MSQRRTRQRWATLVSAACFCGALAACSVAELKSAVTTEEAKQSPGAVPTIRYTRPGDPDILEVTESITGGAQSVTGITGEFARMIIGTGNTILFNRPVAVGGVRDQLFVVDAGNKAIYRYDLTTKALKTLGQAGAQFVGEPSGLHVKSDLSFYVCDPAAKQVLYFDAEGNFVRRFTDFANLARPVDVAVDEERGQVFVADGSYSHIVVFSEFGQALFAIGGRGKTPGKFTAITSLARLKSSLYVTDRLVGLPLQELDMATGTFRFALGQGQVVWPTSVVVDAKNRIFVTDRHDDSIKVFDEVRLVAVIGGRGSAPGRFKEPLDMWMSDTGLLFVADHRNRRVQVFRLLSDTDAMPTAAVPAP
jgi:DNA-binding beta-propeller fold protein YncE